MTRTVYDDDLEARKFTRKPIELLPLVARKYKKSGIQIVKEIWQLSRGPGRLPPSDYFLYQLYDDKKYSMSAKRRFISDSMHWKVVHKITDRGWEALVEDKWICYDLLRHNGFSIPRTVAVIDQSLRSFGPERKISSPAMLRDFLVGLNSYPLFAKVNYGLGSYGAFVIDGVDGDHILLRQSEPIRFNQVFERVIGSRTFLVQEFIENHPDIRAFSKYAATVRAVNLVKSNEVSTLYTLLKIPSATSIADNYWRPGNLLADVNPDTGVIRRVVRGKGLDLEELNDHPETGKPLVGMALPHWSELRKVNDACARLFAPMRYPSLDIALTADGPLVVEVNMGGGFDLPQLATGSGLLTDEFVGFFKACGHSF
jgi:Sugar-transfer associated ATP-grasp